MTRFQAGAIVFLAIAASAVTFFAGMEYGDTPPADRLPVATVTLAPSGMAYCPTDPGVVHPVPCEARP